MCSITIGKYSIASKITREKDAILMFACCQSHCRTLHVARILLIMLLHLCCPSIAWFGSSQVHASILQLFTLRAIPPARGQAGGCASTFAHREFVLASFAILLPVLSLLSSNHRNASCAQQPSSSLSYPSLRIRPSFASDQREPSPDASGTCTSFRHMGKSTRRDVAINTHTCMLAFGGRATD